VIRGAFEVEVHRYDPDGNQIWLTTLPDGADLGPPHLGLEVSDAAVIAHDVGGGFQLARVLGDGTIDWAGTWACAGTVEVHDAAVSSNGADVWIGGVQGSVGFIGNLQ
jgi:hypothetical protein